MKTYTEAEASDDLDAVLEQARKVGPVKIRRQDGSVFIIRALDSEKSPLDVPGIPSNFKPGELVRMIRDDQRRRADRILKAAASGLPQATRKAKSADAPARPRRKSPKP